MTTSMMMVSKKTTMILKKVPEFYFLFHGLYITFNAIEGDNSASMME